MFTKMDEPAFRYVFRGTTLGFKGNATSNRIPSTSTSINPAKALLFALCGQYEYGKTGIVYIADIHMIQFFKRQDGNWFENMEEEIGFSVSPGEFQDRCLGYVLATELRNLLQQESVIVDIPFGTTDLTDVIRGIEVISACKIERIYEAVKGQLKKM